MRGLGYKWSQATVWSVEKGDRPLKLAEADSLSRVLKVPLATLLNPNAEGEQDRHLEMLRKAHSGAVAAASDAKREVEILERALDLAVAEMEPPPMGDESDHG
jgi:hypothetical protein